MAFKNKMFTVDTFLSQDQLSTAEEESNVIAGSEVEALKQTIVDKDREIAELRSAADTAGSVADSGQVPTRGDGGGGA